MSSNPFRKKASAEHPRTSQDEPTPKQEPLALSTSPNRSRASSWEVVDIPPPSPALQKRSPPRPPSRNRGSYIPPAEIIADPFNPTSESPVSSDFEDNDDILTQEPTELSRPMTTSFPSTGNDGGYSVPKSGRQSLDADAFKRLMLTGQSSLSTLPTPGAGLTPVVAPDSSTDTSSISRQSIFDPIMETTDGVPDETPRTSNELDEEEERRRSKERTPKPKPPPPRARNRSGGRSPASPPSATADTPSLTPPRPPSIHSISSERSLPPPPPLPVGSTSPILNETVSPPSPAASIISKKIPPSPPLSRRHSVQSNTNPLRPSTPVASPNNSKMKPPPPPIRRHKSTNSRASTIPLSALSIPPPPPPPPPRRNRSSTANSYESREEPLTTPPAKSSPLPTEPQISIVPGTETDILIDLEKLQREVDELRGKYEGRGVGPAVST
ncbi:hypothetical protein L873DRAFT_1828027 [Choiromyces venosus 120613-1]|uniref:Uncharacterized protein n=1 Tax=Choiromyces venosus 120613-1 TaxID=1336337 RepID=A0A3N4JQF3_9PEZI|nr:hypothetical protein L873DRAFT_1828027 [Choiromyces venosus 120613-1]